MWRRSGQKEDRAGRGRDDKGKAATHTSMVWGI
jgi:hypothetical protein